MARAAAAVCGLKAFGIPCDGARQWLAYHNVVGLHVWLVYRRVKAVDAQRSSVAHAAVPLDAEEANAIGQELYDRFWEDAIERVRETRVRTLARVECPLQTLHEEYTGPCPQAECSYRRRHLTFFHAGFRDAGQQTSQEGAGSHLRQQCGA